MLSKNMTISALKVRGVNVPLKKPLPTSGGVISTVPLVLIDIDTSAGITGSSYIFCYTDIALKATVSLLESMEKLILNEKVTPREIFKKIKASFTLLGLQGLTAMAHSGIDMALWDILAKEANLPLCRLLGGEVKPIKAYGSYFLNGVEGGIEDAKDALNNGFEAMKIKVGYETVEKDIKVIRAIKEVVGDKMKIMIDYNQSLNYTDALVKLEQIDKEEVYWIEEPLRAEDFAGHSKLSEKIKTPIQIGENWWGINDMKKSIDANASGFLMPDVMKIGGVTGWMDAAALANASGLLVSSHLFDEISAHLLAVTPTAHYLESMNLAAPILKNVLQIENGHALLEDIAGNGITWDEEKISLYEI